MCVDQIVDTSVENGIMSNFTSFLIVDTDKCVDTCQEQSKDIIIPNHTCQTTDYAIKCSDIEDSEDALDGGMDMFGGGNSNKEKDTKVNYVEYKTTIGIETLHKIIKTKMTNSLSSGLYVINHEDICNISEDSLIENAKKNNCDTLIYSNTVLFFELDRYSEFQNEKKELLSSIIKYRDTVDSCGSTDNSINSFKMLTILKWHSQYIDELIKLNNKNKYFYNYESDY
jgi:hypothetical protein